MWRSSGCSKKTWRSKQNAELRSQLRACRRWRCGRSGWNDCWICAPKVLADTAVAQVISVETSRQFRVVRVRIDRGGVEVKPGMPVIAAEGVVGRIARSVGPYADVQLLTDARSAIDVVLPRSESRGVMKGTGSDSRYVSRIEYVLKRVDRSRCRRAVFGLGRQLSARSSVGKSHGGAQKRRQFVPRNRSRTERVVCPPARSADCAVAAATARSRCWQARF